VSSPRFPILAGAPGSFTFLIGTDRTISRHQHPCLNLYLYCSKK